MLKNDSLSAVVGASLVSRIETLKALASSSSREQPFRFRGSKVNLPVVSVKITLPVYRVANRRTKTLQEEYLTKHPDLPGSFFETDKDSIAVQEAQDEILRGLIADKELYDVFSNPNVHQDEPIICTRQGVVVNGNRRLCAWRKLFADEPSKYGHFESVEVMLLPEDTEESDINNIERDLQIKKSIKADYSWHARANMIRMDYEQVNSYEELNRMYDMQKSELDLAMDCYAYAKAYLASIDKAGQWSLVDKQEYAFQKIVKEKNKITAVAEGKVFEACAAAVLQANAESIGNRRYDIIPQIAKNLKPIIDVLKRDILPASEAPKVEDPFGMVDANSGDAVLYKVEHECRKPENLEKTVEIVNAIIETANVSARDARASHLLVEDLTAVSTRLISIKNQDLDDRQEDLASARNQLMSIEDTCRTIKEWLDRHEARS